MDAAEDSTFYFEGDHAVLRENADYNNMLRYITMRLAQRASLRKHIDELMNLEKIYTNDPGLFLEKVRNNATIIPKYYSTSEKLPVDLKKLPIVIKREVEAPAATESLIIKQNRFANEDKTDTFNLLWSCEEQRRLEELLIKYPPEDIEMRRFAKIAKGLGTRTPLQVSSRVQKYFQKLHDAGLPIPGRIPKNRRSNAKTKAFHRSSTFFPAFQVPVNMPEDDNDILNFTKAERLPISEATGAEKPSYNKDHAAAINLLKLMRDKLRTRSAATLMQQCESCQLMQQTCSCWNCVECNWRKIFCADCMTKKLMFYNFEHLLHNVTIEH